MPTIAPSSGPTNWALEHIRVLEEAGLTECKHCGKQYKLPAGKQPTFTWELRHLREKHDLSAPEPQSTPQESSSRQGDGAKPATSAGNVVATPSPLRALLARLEETLNGVSASSMADASATQLRSLDDVLSALDADLHLCLSHAVPSAATPPPTKAPTLAETKAITVASPGSDALLSTVLTSLDSQLAGITSAVADAPTTELTSLDGILSALDADLHALLARSTTTSTPPRQATQQFGTSASPILAAPPAPGLKEPLGRLVELLPGVQTAVTALKEPLTDRARAELKYLHAALESVDEGIRALLSHSEAADSTNPFSTAPHHVPWNFSSGQGAPPATAPAGLQFKCVLVGDGGVGKTAYVKRLLTGDFETRYVATLGTEVHSLALETTRGKVTLNLWDTAGQEKFGGLRDGYWIGGQCALVFFDRLSAPTFQSAPRWLSDVRRICEGIPIVVVGTKVDDPADAANAVRLDDTTFPARAGIPYVDASVKANVHMLTPLRLLLRALLHDDLLDIFSVGTPYDRIPEGTAKSVS